MTFAEMRLSLQLLAEERIGARMRGNAYAAKAREDALWDASLSGLA